MLPNPEITTHSQGNIHENKEILISSQLLYGITNEDEMDLSQASDPLGDDYKDGYQGVSPLNDNDFKWRAPTDKSNNEFGVISFENLGGFSKKNKNYKLSTQSLDDEDSNSKDSGDLPELSQDGEYSEEIQETKNTFQDTKGSKQSCGSDLKLPMGQLQTDMSPGYKRRDAKLDPAQVRKLLLEESQIIQKAYIANLSPGRDSLLCRRNKKMASELNTVKSMLTP